MFDCLAWCVIGITCSLLDYSEHAWIAVFKAITISEICDLNGVFIIAKVLA